MFNIFTYFSTKMYVVGAHYKRFDELLLQSTQNICFCKEMRNIVRVDSRYLEVQGTLSGILRDIGTWSYQICKIEENINQTTTFNK